MMRRHLDLPLNRDGSVRFLPWIVALMVYLASLALAGTLVVRDVVTRWDRGLTGTLTVELPAKKSSLNTFQPRPAAQKGATDALSVAQKSIDSQNTQIARTAKATISRATAKMVAARGDITPVTNGRRLVRSMMASMSRSITMLKALAPPAASVPPMRVATMSQAFGQPLAATIIVGTVVMSNNSMIRGFVRAR